MRTKKGIVTAAKMQDTVTVTVHRSMVHPIYKKRYGVDTKFLADTNGNDPRVGDEVLITECRPLSKRKYFRVTEILKRAAQVSEMAEESALTEVMTKKKDESSVPGRSSSDQPTSDKRPSSSDK